MTNSARDHTHGVPARRRHVRRPVAAMAGVFLVLGVAGLLFATSAETANGTQLRTDPADAVGLLRAEQARYAQRAERVRTLQQQVEGLTEAAAGNDSQVAALQAQSGKLVAVAGLEAVTGPGLQVTLDDAPRGGTMPTNVKPDDLVVHQQDVQAVVNALWAGGAEALELMDQRVISTSAVRCVGNTLILQGRVYSPPYKITAIGPVNRMRDAIDASPEIDIYQQYVQGLGLGWSLDERSSVTVPAFTGSMELRYATVPGQAAAGASGTVGTGGTSPPSTGSTTGSSTGSTTGRTPSSTGSGASTSQP